MSTTVVHVNDVDLADPSVTYIGRAVPRRGIRASKWGNPWVVGKPLFRNGPIPSVEKILDLYRERVTGSPDLLAALPELVGKKLACWCKHRGDEPCHGDVLVALLRERGLERTP